MPEPKVMWDCFMCGKQFQMGPHIYDGTVIPRYKIQVCNGCYQGNWDGWAPHYEARLVEHLKESGLPIPERNEKGWLPRD